MEIIKFIDICLDKRASDLHIIPGLQPYLRLDGQLLPINETNILSSEDSKRLIYELLTKEQQQILEKESVYEMAWHLPERGHFRVSIYHQMNGLAAVLRIVPQKIPTFEELGLPVFFKSLCGLSHGLILVTGPVGSGKSTTLAAMIDNINTFRNCNIITIEDPIEFVHQSKRSIFNQLQIGRDTPNFAIALRSALRQDPNVILLGELRDIETIRLALTAAETGHLVITTLHASSAPTAISRFVDVFPFEEKASVRNLLAETLQAVISQTLVKRINGGRVAAFELLLTTPAIRHYIRQDMPSHMESAMQTSGSTGMITLDQSLDELVKKGIVTPSVATSVTDSRKSFKEIYKKDGREKQSS